MEKCCRELASVSMNLKYNSLSVCDGLYPSQAYSVPSGLYEISSALEGRHIKLYPFKHVSYNSIYCCAVAAHENLPACFIILSERLLS